jgi:hypothetical protein
MNNERNKASSNASRAQMDVFLRKVAATPVAKSADSAGRLIFAMDATASREPTWDRACHIQSQMFEATAALGGLQIQLVYYRGYGEFVASPWLIRSVELLRRMTAVSCLGGYTQIAKVLRHTLGEAKRIKINALVFVGDCVEEEVDELCQLAGELGMFAVPLFIFHEGQEPVAAKTFQQMARLTHGAYCRFDVGSAQQLRELLSAVAVYAAGGHKALEALGTQRGGLVRQLSRQLASERK